MSGNLIVVCSDLADGNRLPKPDYETVARFPVSAAAALVIMAMKAATGIHGVPKQSRGKRRDISQRVTFTFNFVYNLFATQLFMISVYFIKIFNLVQIS